MTGLPDPAPVREYLHVDPQIFAEIRAAEQPAVLRGIGAHWSAVHASQRSVEEGLAYLLSFGPLHPVNALIGAPEIEGRFFYNSDYSDFNFTRGEVPLEMFFERLLRDRDAERPFALAVQSEIVPDLLPGFTQTHATGLLDPSIQPRIWMGNRIRVAPHFDLKENIGVVVMGTRRFTLFPPEQLPNLYMGPLELTPAGTPVSIVDIANPDLDRFPLYAEAAKHAQVATLEPGDGIYIPFHWWHAVDSLGTVNAFVNYWWNDAPEDAGRVYDALLHALYAFRALPPDQRRVWNMALNHLVFTDDPLAHMPPHAKGVLGPVTPAQLARMKATLRQIAGQL